MSRSVVEEILGQPIEPDPPGIYRLPEFEYILEASQSTVRVKYSQENTVIRVSGDSLEWPGGHLGVRTPASVIRQSFPPPQSVTPGSLESSATGKWTYPHNDLQIQMRIRPPGTESRFYRAQLGVPFVYPFASYWRGSGANDPLSIVASEASSVSRDSLQAGEIVGCFFCVERFNPEDLLESAGAARCPSCRGQNLIGGLKEELTLEYLEQVRQLWMTPREGKAARP